MNMFNLVNSKMFVKKPPKNNTITIKYDLDKWVGMSHDTFKKITQYIHNKRKKNNPNKTIIVQIHNGTRIQLCNVYNWCQNKLIDDKTYDTIRTFLRNRLNCYNKSFQINLWKNTDKNICKISIHIRKGDVFERPLHKSVNYYKNIIKQLKLINKKKKIIIFTEQWKGYDGKDVYDLLNLNDINLQIEIIFKMCLYEYFTTMTSSDIFVPTIGQGSMSDLVINYKNNNTIVIINNELRKNKFYDNMNNQLVKTSNDGIYNLSDLNNSLDMYYVQ